MKQKVTGLLLAAIAFATIGVAVAAADPPSQDENWLMTSIAGDRFEIAGGKIALRRATVEANRVLARRLIADHAKSLREGLDLARRWGINPPPSALPAQQWQLNRLKNIPRQNFDA